MFGKQEQIVNVNEILSQMKDGMTALGQIQTLSDYMTSIVRQNHYDFLSEKDKCQENNKKFYTFCYPFKVLDDELNKVAQMIGYEIDTDLMKDVVTDLEYAIEWNKTHKED